MLKTGGQIYTTHKTAYPFSEWKIKELAEKIGISLIVEEEFYLSNYPGYVNKRGSGDRIDASFPIGKCSTFGFALYALLQP
ncbi:hypothetical protein Ancab_004609, partial [Ancistrocladus abbreviatus]